MAEVSISNDDVRKYRRLLAQTSFNPGLGYLSRVANLLDELLALRASKERFSEYPLPSGHSKPALAAMAALEFQKRSEQSRPEELIETFPMDTAPRDGTIVRLLVDYSGEGEHPLEDDEIAWTIGANSSQDTGEDEPWRFAGWCWSHDHWTEGKGRPIAWAPFAAAAPVTVVGDELLNAAMYAYEKSAGFQSADTNAMRQALAAYDERKNRASALAPTSAVLDDEPTLAEALLVAAEYLESSGRETDARRADLLRSEAALASRVESEATAVQHRRNCLAINDGDCTCGAEVE
jgi:hypothetical protein